MVRTAAAVLLAALLLAACSDDEPESGPSRDPAEAGVDDLRPAGTELADGLVVPEGAQLAGTVFRRPAPPVVPAVPPATVVPVVPETTTPPEVPATTSPPTTTARPEVDPALEGWEALLPIDGDPFTAWDDLAAQVRAQGAAVGGSAAACAWVLELPGGGTVPAPHPVVDGAPDGPISHLECGAAASDGTRHVNLHLRYGGAHTGVLVVTVVADTSGHGASPGGPAGAEEVGAGPRDLLPEPSPATHPAPGDRFGGEANCFAEGTQMVLPAGARLVATAGGPDGASVLAVDDVETAIEAMLDTAGEGLDAANFEPAGVHDLPLADGGTATTTGFSISAGGGACDLLGSPDGRHVLLTMHSD